MKNKIIFKKIHLFIFRILSITEFNTFSFSCQFKLSQSICFRELNIRLLYIQCKHPSSLLRLYFKNETNYVKKKNSLCNCRTHILHTELNKWPEKKTNNKAPFPKKICKNDDLIHHHNQKRVALGKGVFYYYRVWN